MMGVVPEQNMEKQIEKQMGCMAGFLQIFDRNQLLAGKRLYATKRLPLSSGLDSTPESMMGSPEISRELEKPLQHQQQQARIMPSPDRSKQSPVTEPRSPTPEAPPPVDTQSKMPLPLPIFELKEGTKTSWKFCKEAPRLSLDSRATFDAKGSLKPREIRTNASILSASRSSVGNQEETDENDRQRRSPSVIARLMGLEPLPADSDPEPAKKPELRRSASESRASRDLLQYRFIDGVNFQLKQGQQQQQNSQNGVSPGNAVRDNAVMMEQRLNGRAGDPIARNARTVPARAPHRGLGQRKSFFDSADFFPEPKQTVSIYGEIERRLRMRGIDEPSKDLETLKQILEALQLKGLLHSKKPQQINNRNYVYDESPIVVMKPARPSPPPRRMANSRPGVRREQNGYGDGISPRRERPEMERAARSQIRGRNASCSPTRSESSAKSPNRRRPLSVETQQRRGCNDTVEQRRVSPVQSPKVGLRRTGPDQAVNRSPRNRRPTVEIYQREEKVFVPAEDDLSTVSESSISTSSHTDTERSRVEDYKEGKNLLERCDKLLHSIAEMTATTELQPSPVSVLDASFYKEESSPSPVMKRSVDFKDQLSELEDDIWGPEISLAESKLEENSDNCDFIYISDILRASNYLPEDSDMFLLLEKQQYLKGKDTSKVSRLQRKLIFDTTTEILSKKRQLPPWKAVSCNNGQISLQQIWSEFQKIRERDSSEDLFEVICGVLKKDLAGDPLNGWGDCPIEMSETVLDIERLIFKDLIGETIRDLAAFTGKGRCNQLLPVPRRKLVF
ncbi:hypothetical protein Tsubulata_004962 [Turnera subulata]|uniref:DUF4378 domain-containing protein n=1 Tax=Turnera subulata TaxID=218843 RepID=A0A9Q0FD94_9ROSI|nr:hypothetical protein Tsubulata_004962 [Turnera subulata]